MQANKNQRSPPSYQTAVSSYLQTNTQQKSSTNANQNAQSSQYLLRDNNRGSLQKAISPTRNSQQKQVALLKQNSKNASHNSFKEDSTINNRINASSLLKNGNGVITGGGGFLDGYKTKPETSLSPYLKQTNNRQKNEIFSPSQIKQSTRNLTFLLTKGKESKPNESSNNFNTKREGLEKQNQREQNNDCNNIYLTPQTKLNYSALNMQQQQGIENNSAIYQNTNNNLHSTSQNQYTSQLHSAFNQPPQNSNNNNNVCTINLCDQQNIFKNVSTTSKNQTPLSNININGSISPKQQESQYQSNKLILQQNTSPMNNPTKPTTSSQIASSMSKYNQFGQIRNSSQQPNITNMPISNSHQSISTDAKQSHSNTKYIDLVSSLNTQTKLKQSSQSQQQFFNHQIANKTQSSQNILSQPIIGGTQLNSSNILSQSKNSQNSNSDKNNTLNESQNIKSSQQSDSENKQINNHNIPNKYTPIPSNKINLKQIDDSIKKNNEVKQNNNNNNNNYISNSMNINSNRISEGQQQNGDKKQEIMNTKRQQQTNFQPCILQECEIQNIGQNVCFVCSDKKVKYNVINPNTSVIYFCQKCGLDYQSRQQLYNNNNNNGINNSVNSDQQYPISESIYSPSTINSNQQYQQNNNIKSTNLQKDEQFKLLNFQNNKGQSYINQMIPIDIKNNNENISQSVQLQNQNDQRQHQIPQNYQSQQQQLQQSIMNKPNQDIINEYFSQQNGSTTNYLQQSQLYGQQKQPSKTIDNQINSQYLNIDQINKINLQQDQQIHLKDDQNNNIDSQKLIHSPIPNSIPQQNYIEKFLPKTETEYSQQNNQNKISNQQNGFDSSYSVYQALKDQNYLQSPTKQPFPLQTQQPVNNINNIYPHDPNQLQQQQQQLLQQQQQQLLQQQQQFQQLQQSQSPQQQQQPMTKTNPIQQQQEQPKTTIQLNSPLKPQKTEEEQKEDYQLKREKLQQFQDRLYKVKGEFENLQKQYIEQNEQSLQEHHKKIEYIEKIKTTIIQEIEQITQTVNNQMINNFNENLGKCKSNQFEIQQVLNYLNCTENDLTSNIDSIIKDMDIDSLKDIIQQYEQIISQYEDVKSKKFLKQQFIGYQLKYNNNDVTHLNISRQKIKDVLDDLLQTISYTHNIMRNQINMNQLNNNNNNNQVDSNQKQTFQNSFHNSQPKSIYVSFENRDIFQSIAHTQNDQNLNEGQPQSPQFQNSQNFNQNINQSNSSNVNSNVHQLATFRDIIQNEEQQSNQIKFNNNSNKFNNNLIQSQQFSNNNNNQNKEITMNQQNQYDQIQSENNQVKEQQQLQHDGSNYSLNPKYHMNQKQLEEENLSKIQQLTNEDDDEIQKDHTLFFQDQTNKIISNDQPYLSSYLPNNNNNNVKQSVEYQLQNLNPEQQTYTPLNQIYNQDQQNYQNMISSNDFTSKLKRRIVSDINSDSQDKFKRNNPTEGYEPYNNNNINNNNINNNQKTQANYNGDYDKIRSEDFKNGYLKNEINNDINNKIIFRSEDNLYNKIINPLNNHNNNQVSNVTSTTANTKNYNGYMSSNQSEDFQFNQSTATTTSNSNNINNNNNNNNLNHINFTFKNKQKYNDLLQKIQVNQSYTEKLCTDVLSSGNNFKFSQLDDNQTNNNNPLRISEQQLIINKKQ